MGIKAINRLKVILAEQLGKNEATISRLCTNEVQPPVKTFVLIAEKLNIKLTSLFND
ncbi:helix-turn-helix transcriptional regulator [Elizabethkingia anophelis]|nr:helix-turn-helix transcriptional regulator [Elizabethkingia anophelis]